MQGVCTLHWIAILPLLYAMFSNLFLLALLQAISLCHCQLSFTVTRSESGDEVASSLTSADYCSGIHGYLDGSQCKCDTRYTFSLDRQTCVDYYNGKNNRTIVILNVYVVNL